MDGWKEGKMGKWMDKWIDRQTRRQAGREIDRLLHITLCKWGLMNR